VRLYSIKGGASLWLILIIYNHYLLDHLWTDTMRSLWVTSVFLASLAEGQFEQRWHWQSIGTPLVPKPLWRRESHLPYREVLFPPDAVILEYNCAKMPSICRNVANWHADASKQWAGKWDGYFTYDFGTGETQTLPAFQLARRRPTDTRKTVSNWRRENCPDTWKGNASVPRCPEPDQPVCESWLSLCVQIPR